jgi:hypothetical protein
VLAAVAAAAVGGSQALASHPTRLRAQPVPTFVYTPGYGNSILTRADPLTLEQTGPRLRLGGNASSWSYSPRGRFLAVASFPQRLSVIDVTTMRSLGRVRLAAGGGVVHAVTWTGSGHVLGVVDTPRGALVVAVDPRARRVVARTQFVRPFGYAFARLNDGLVFLLGARGRIAPAQVAVVDEDGRTRIATVAQAPIGIGIDASGDFEQRQPGFVVDLTARKVYLVSGERVFSVDLRALTVSGRGQMRIPAKWIGGSFRSAVWLGGGRIAVSGADYRSGTRTPIGLRVIDLRTATSRIIDADASSFTLTGNLLLVESAVAGRSFRATAYEFDGGVRYRLELPSVTWMKAQGTRGYACDGVVLRAIVDLRSGALLRQATSSEARCSTVLTDDSRS